MLPNGHAGPRCADDLLQDRASLRPRRGFARAKESRKLTLHSLGNQPGHSRCAQDLLGLTLELRLGKPYRDDRRHALEHVLFEHFVAVLQQACVLEGTAECLGQSALETGDMSAAL